MLRHALATTAVAICLMPGAGFAACESSPFEEEAQRVPYRFVAPACPSRPSWAGVPAVASASGSGSGTSEALDAHGHEVWDPQAPSAAEFFDSGSTRRSLLSPDPSTPRFRSVFGLDGIALFVHAPKVHETPRDGEAVQGWLSRLTGQQPAAARTESSLSQHASAIRAPGGAAVQVLALLLLSGFLLRRTWGR